VQNHDPDDATKAIVVVKGAGLNVLAVQDVGTYRMLLDECTYLVSVASPACLWELALLLSHPKKRAILWTSHDSNTSTSTAIHSILQLYTTLLPKTDPKQEEELSWNATTNDDNYRHGDHHHHHHVDVDDDDDDNAAVPFIGDPTKMRRRIFSTKPSFSASTCTSTDRYYQALACILYFLSLDCTTTTAATTTTTAATASATAVARQHRMQILSNASALEGLSHLLLTDVQQQPPATMTRATTTIPLQSTINGSSQPSCSITPITKLQPKDPTASGRRRRLQSKQRTMTTTTTVLPQKLAPIQELEVEQQLTFTRSDERTVVPPLQNNTPQPPKQETLIPSRVRAKVKVPYCEACTDDKHFIQLVTMDALTRILQGKNEGDETSILDDAPEEEQDPAEYENLDEEEQLKLLQASNPLLVTNRLLLESNALQVLATAMSNALKRESTASTATSTASNTTTTTPAVTASCCCAPCHARYVSSLAAVMDGACLLSDENRSALCASSLVGTMAATVGDPSTPMHVLLPILRTLTSLTHDNPIAGPQLPIPTMLQCLHRLVQCTFSSSDTSSAGGTTTTTTTTMTAPEAGDYAAEPQRRNTDEEEDVPKQRYDCIIFLLNTLTNVVETAPVATTLLLPCTKSNDPSSSLLWLQFLTRWIMSETAPFRAAMASVSAGSLREGNEDDHVAPLLERHAEEHLVTAGNGFILLACLAVASDECQSVVEHELQHAGGFAFLLRVLQAFLNFYYCSIGDLSVAVVAPVKEIMVRLKTKMGGNDYR